MAGKKGKQSGKQTGKQKRETKQSRPDRKFKTKQSHGKDNIRREKNITETVVCHGLDHEGKGLATFNETVISVGNLMPKEEAIVAVKSRSGQKIGVVQKILKASPDRVKPPCPYYEACGGCQLQHMSVSAQKKFKASVVTNLLKQYGQVETLVHMETPYNYRNKSHTTFGMTDRGQIVSGMYAENTHRLIQIDRCLIQDPIADKITQTIKGMMKSFKMQPYDEDAGVGFLRHVLIKVGKVSGQIMVVLVTGTHMFPGKNNYVKALRKAHPEITTIIQNINDKETSMILGQRENILFGKGWITDRLCGLDFEISSKSFYQINPEQTEKLYKLAVDMAELTGKETVVDAYCGIGTIGLIASKKAKNVIGVERNKDAVKDAIRNAKRNNVKNARFYADDAGQFMVGMAGEGEKADVVIMDPPRSGSTEEFMQSVVKLNPKRVVYVSCNPQTQARDLKYFESNGYKVERIVPVDMFPQTYHVETCCLLKKVDESDN